MKNIQSKNSMKNLFNDFQKKFLDKKSDLFKITNVLFITEPYWTKSFWIKKPPNYLGLRGVFFFMLVSLIRILFSFCFKKAIIKKIFKQSNSLFDVFSNILGKLQGDYVEHYNIRHSAMKLIKKNYDNFLYKSK